MSEDKVKRLLDQFEKNKDWADLVNWLNKVKLVIQNPGLKRIPLEETLAKRLSQCLNQSLPISVHNLALEIYDMIFKHHFENGSTVDSGTSKAWGNSIGYYSPGLFSFYQFSKLEVKLKFNDLIKNHYLRLGAEILPCLNGLISIMLLGLEDSNEDATKGIEEILQALEHKVGTRIFFGTIWLAILRTSKIRYPAFRYIYKTIPSSIDNFPISKIFINQDSYVVSNNQIYSNELRVTSSGSMRPITMEELLFHFFPQKSQLVVNALVQSLQDENVFTQRSAFDFMISHLPLKSDILSFGEKVCLVEAGCQLLLKKNDSIFRRFYSWLIGDRGEELEEMAILKNDISLKVFVKAIHNIFNNVPKDKNAATAPIQILKTVFEDNEGLIDKVLPDIASAMVRYLERYKSGYEFSEELATFAKKFLFIEKQFISHSRRRIGKIQKLFGVDFQSLFLNILNS